MTHVFLDDLLTGQGSMAIPPETGLSEACTLMARHGVTALPVVKGGRLKGVVVWHAIIGRALAEHGTLRQTLVADLMARTPLCLPASASLAEARALLQGAEAAHLAVTDAAGGCLGLVSQDDLTEPFPPIARQHPAENHLRAAAE